MGTTRSWRRAKRTQQRAAARQQVNAQCNEQLSRVFARIGLVFDLDCRYIACTLYRILLFITFGQTDRSLAGLWAGQRPIVWIHASPHTMCEESHVPCVRP